MLVFIGFVLILLLVVAHEAGHFFAARRSGVDVEEFGVGFPPRAKLLTKKKGTEYTLNWLPLGGFVKLKGEHDADTTPGSFGAARLRDKVKIMVAGVGVNFLIAYVLFTLIALVGIPQLVENQFSVDSNATTVRQDVLAGYVAEDSPAAKATATSSKGENLVGITNNDVLVSIESTDCSDDTCSEGTILLKEPQDLGTATEKLAGQEVAVTVERPGFDTPLRFTTNLLSLEEVEKSRDTDNPKGYLGIVPTGFSTLRYTWAAPIVGAGTTAQFTELTFKGLWSIVSGLAKGDTQAATEQVSGVVGVGFIFSSASFLGPVFMLMIVAVISLSLAIMNILPIPALDGGRLFVTLLFRALKKPLTKEVEERIHGTGFAALILLFVLITIIDVQRFII